MIPATTGEQRAEALRRYSREIPAEDLAELTQPEFDGMLQRARQDWEIWAVRDIAKANGWRKKP